MASAVIDGKVEEKKHSEEEEEDVQMKEND
jgi:hypothetical protein